MPWCCRRITDTETSSREETDLFMTHSFPLRMDPTPDRPTEASKFGKCLWHAGGWR
ncbi:hypothetical protein RB213_011158 [Colletotrichum asianum]